MIETPLPVTTSSSGTDPATLPPCAAAMSTITLPDFIEGTMSSVISRGGGRAGVLGDQPRGGPAGDQRGGDDDVHVRRLLGVHLRGPPVEVLAHLPGVAVGTD